MTNVQKKEALQKLIEFSSSVSNKNSSDPDFKIWKYRCERTLSSIYGANSSEVTQFESLDFYYNPGIWLSGVDYSANSRRCFEHDFKEAINLFNMLLEDFDNTEESEDDLQNQKSISKVFISHSSKDVEIVENFVDLLETIGLDTNQIFCTSLSGYGIPLGDNFIDKLKTELTNSNSLVIFMLSENFYKSPVCMCEMGATWIQSKEHIPVLIPPFDFKDIDGTLKLTQGFIINDSMKWNEFKDKILQIFGLEDLSNSVWERKRDRTINRINEEIGENNE